VPPAEAPADNGSIMIDIFLVGSTVTIRENGKILCRVIAQTTAV